MTADAFTTALTWLSARELSESQIRTRLRRREFDADDIDAAIGRDHPSTGGHAYLATRLAEALAALGDGAEVAADAPRESELTGP